MSEHERDEVIGVGRKYQSVHDAHCCPTHGCKYGDDDCPVVVGRERGVPCEECADSRLKSGTQPSITPDYRLPHECSGCGKLIINDIQEWTDGKGRYWHGICVPPLGNEISKE